MTDSISELTPQSHPNAFSGQLMHCIVCDTEQQSDPAAPSNWRALQLDDLLYYVCPNHLPLDGASQETFHFAWQAILTRALEVHQVNQDMRAIRRLLESGHALNLRVKAKDLYMVIVAVQFAGRHPKAASLSPLKVANAAARSWQKHFKREIQNILDRGWNPAFDLSPTDPPAPAGTPTRPRSEAEGVEPDPPAAGEAES